MEKEMRGVVKWFHKGKGYGFIKPEGDGDDVLVHISAIEQAGLNILHEGQRIEFDLVQRQGSQSAQNLKLSSEPSADEILLAEEILEQDSSVASKQLIKEVADWKLEAKSEDNDRYFFHVKEVSRIENGEKCYVIGRKGSGKTAISEYLGRLSDYNTFSEKLTFKNFPFK